MRRHRVIGAAVLTVAVLCLQSASASASSTLLSGYGGPGQGNQAIIGATLIGGGGSGGGSGSESASAGAASSASASIALAQAPAKTSAKHSARHRAGGAPHAQSVTPAKASGSSGSLRAVVPAAERSTGGTLGLTGADALYIILACCLLGATAFLTVRLGGRTGRAGGAR